jgi:hypothetical protein
VGNSGRFIFVVASSGLATLVNISQAITTRIECDRDGGCNETMGRHIPYESRSDYATVALLILIAGLFCFDVFILIYGINNGINDFRQSQTALTAYWLDREPHGLAYITPVLGYPWSVPFEYPVYQWIVVLLMKVGVPLVVGGRIVSFAAFVGCLVPLKVMARDFNVPNRVPFRRRDLSRLPILHFLVAHVHDRDDRAVLALLARGFRPIRTFTKRNAMACHPCIWHLGRTHKIHNLPQHRARRRRALSH